MKTLAFYFKGQEAASAAQSALRGVSGIDPTQLAVAPLVVEGEEGIVLALSAEPAALPEVVELVQSHGGRLVADVPNEWL